jgi:hypothetical protein
VIVGAFCAAAAVLLVVAGVAKIRTAAPAAAMIVLLLPRIRRGRVIARVTGAVEVMSGLVALATGGRVALAVLAGCYLVLTLVATRLATGPQHAPCGCFGAADGTVGAAHVVFDSICLAAAVAGLVRAPGSVFALLDGGTLAGVIVVGQALLLAALGYLSITALPALSAARREVEGVR